MQAYVVFISIINTLLFDPKQITVTAVIKKPDIWDALRGDITEYLTSQIRQNSVLKKRQNKYGALVPHIYSVVKEINI
jgi:hypothetical protein